ncbi:MAG: DUF2807 domain-containing protein [Cytophagales bacterium]|nr:DUF2807 domain-containing protein [Cytophagales bacterium]
MKKLVFLLIGIVPALGFAQKKGNKNIITETYAYESIRSVVVNLYAEVQIDASANDNEFTITIDENLLNKVDRTLDTHGRLTLVQTEWIQPSEKIKISIGAPDLERVQQEVHETVVVNNLDRVSFNSMAIVGRIKLNGKVTEYRANGEIGYTDARGLETEKVYLNLWDRGRMDLGTAQKIQGNVEEGGIVIYRGSAQVKTSGKGQVLSANQSATAVNPDARFIKFDVKNNSLKRINCYVVGPKPDGSKFSYGFPMNPGQTRAKDWSIGSKVFKVSALGTRKLLKEITAEDEGQKVKLFP